MEKIEEIEERFIIKENHIVVNWLSQECIKAHEHDEGKLVGVLELVDEKNLFRSK